MSRASSEISESELQYLISFESEDRPVVEESYELSDGDGSSQIQIAGLGERKPNVFRIQITADSEENCVSYMKAAEKAIENYSLQLQEQIEDLTALLQAFRNGEIIEDHKE